MEVNLDAILQRVNVKKADSPTRPATQSYLAEPRESFQSGFDHSVKFSEQEGVAMLKCGLPLRPEPLGSQGLKEALSAGGLSESWPDLKDAYYFAKGAHHGQTRDDGTPYYHHCARVARNAIENFGVRDTAALKAALLHDVLEDTSVKESEIARRFGTKTLEYVKLLSKREPMPGESYEDRNRRLIKELEGSNSRNLIGLKLADRLDNVEDTHLMPDRQKIVRYMADTRENYVPLAQRHFPNLVENFTTRLDQIDKWLANSNH